MEATLQSPQNRTQICDVCNASTSWGEGTTYTADEFRKLVSLGFEPSGFALSVGEAFFGRTLALAQWKQGLVANSTTDWLLCPSCAARAAKYLPKPAGTGPSSNILSEPFTPEMLAPLFGRGFLPGSASQAKRELKSAKKWWQFWK